MTKKKEKTLLSTYQSFIILPVFIIALIIAAAIALIVSYALTNIRWLLITFVIFAALSLGGYIAIYYFVIRKLRRVFYDQLFSVTLSNIKRIDNNIADLQGYGDTLSTTTGSFAPFTTMF